jgi:hypothetical protein
MRVSNLGLVGVVVVVAAGAAIVACGSHSGGFGAGGGGNGNGEGGALVDGGDDGSLGDGAFGGTFSNDGSPTSGTLPDAGTAKGTFTAPDCSGCTFPATSAPACASSAPAIKLVYPSDGVLVPPNMNIISVQWSPFGGYTEYEVDFSNSITDTRIITKCSTQTMDTGQPAAASGGCAIDLTPQEWSLLVNANRGGQAVTISVRGTTDGKCASKSVNSVRLYFAQEDLYGDIYYWKSTVSSAGTGGQIWAKSFGNTMPETQITGVGNLTGTCNGCHALSRDGQRMVVYSDDNDSDDEYNDISGSLIDMTMKTVIAGGNGNRNGQPPGFSTLSPTHGSYLTSNGKGTAPTNNFVLYNGNTGATIATITFGAAADRPTMPDWSPDGKSVIYTLPNKVATWDNGTGGLFGGGFGGPRNDDDHMFGGSLYTLAYTGNNAFSTTPVLFLKSNGENNYYPSYSPDGQFVVFDRAPQNMSVSTIDGCSGSSPTVFCPNDSFSNPAARLMLVQNVANSTPIDLQQANGSTTMAAVPLSNSWPRWSPFVQTYRGNRLLWIAFSSTRDYGLLVRNHLSGMYQCYPPDSYELAGASHGSTFAPQCQQPKLWMAAINLSESKGGDPSFPAFYLPYQDITTHNHTPQWTEEVIVPPPPPDAGTCVMMGGDCATDPQACCMPLTCQGTGTCQPVLQ